MGPIWGTTWFIDMSFALNWYCTKHSTKEAVILQMALHHVRSQFVSCFVIDWITWAVLFVHLWCFFSSTQCVWLFWGSCLKKLAKKQQPVVIRPVFLTTRFSNNFVDKLDLNYVWVFLVTENTAVVSYTLCKVVYLVIEELYLQMIHGGRYG